MARKDKGETASQFSVPALVTYWLLGIWTLVIGSVFQLVHDKIMIDGVLLALVSGIIGTQTTLLVAAVSFWVGATVGGKEANERMGKANEVATAALTTIAAAGTGTGTAAAAGAPAAAAAAVTEALTATDAQIREAVDAVRATGEVPGLGNVNARLATMTLAPITPEHLTAIIDGAPE